MNLQGYLAAANNSTTETIRDNSEFFRLTESVDELFARAAGRNIASSPFVAILNMNSRLLYTASIRLATSGHQAAIFPLLRTSLESACYAYLISRKPDLGEIWANRHRDDASMKKCRNTFNSAVSDCAKQMNIASPTSGSILEEMYQQMINDGGHPNTRSIVRALSIEDAGENWEVRLHAVDPGRVDLSLFCCAEIGLYTTWPMGAIEPIDQEFWKAAAFVNDVKNELGEKLRSSY